MNDLWRYTKKHFWVVLLVVLILLFAILIVPLIINWLFTKPANCKFLAVDWEASDALSYYGSALGFIGTVIFSGLALWQNHVIQQANDKHTMLLERMERIKNAPHLAAISTLSYGGTSRLKMEIKNTSENIAENIILSGFEIINELGESVWKNDEKMTLDYLTNERRWEIQWENPSVTSPEHQFVFNVRYTDKFGDVHICRAVGVFGKKFGLPQFKITEL